MSTTVKQQPATTPLLAHPNTALAKAHRLSKQLAMVAWSALAMAVTYLTPSTVFAQTATATATANQATASAKPTLTEHSVDDMVAISKAAQTNDALNDAVLNNQAIKETLGHDALRNDALPVPNTVNPSATVATADPINTPTTTPRQSTQAPVAADKLILNNPVIDEAKVLSASDKQTLEIKLRSINERGLAQAAVVIVPTTNGEDIFDYSMKVANRWQLGKKDTDQGY